MSSSAEDDQDDERPVESVNRICGNCNEVASILFGTVLVTNRRDDEEGKAVPSHIPISKAIAESFQLQANVDSDIGLCQECSEVFTILFNSQREFAQLQKKSSVVHTLINNNRDNQNDLSPSEERSRQVGERFGKRQRIPPPPVKSPSDSDFRNDEASHIKSTRSKSGRDGKRKNNPFPVKEANDGDRNSDDDFRNDYSDEGSHSETDKSEEDDEEYEPRAPTRTSSRRSTLSEYHTKSSPVVESRSRRKSAVAARQKLRKINKGSESDEESDSGQNRRPNTRNGDKIKKRLKTESDSEENNVSDAEANDGHAALEDSADNIGVSDSKLWPCVTIELLDEDLISTVSKSKPGPLSSKRHVVENEKLKSKPGPLSSKRHVVENEKLKSKPGPLSSKRHVVENEKLKSLPVAHKKSSCANPPRAVKGKKNKRIQYPDFGPQNTCAMCEVSYRDVYSVKKHYRRVHRKGGQLLQQIRGPRKQYPDFGPDYTCPECQQTFYDGSSVRKHYVRMHDTSPKTLNKSFPNAKSKLKHGPRRKLRKKKRVTSSSESSSELDSEPEFIGHQMQDDDDDEDEESN